MAHIWDELNFDRFEFRILELQPGESGSQIQCSLRHESLNEPPSYVALSYCCGDPSVTTEIIVNGGIVNVTPNLNKALQYCRQAGVRFLWADAICINQFNTQEKSHQIRQMNLVYSRAAYTISWLGDGSDLKVISAIEFLQQLNKEVDDRYLNYADFILELKPPTAERGFNRLWSRPKASQKGHLKWFQEDSTALWLAKGLSLTLELFRCAYWSRRWIIQEIAVSRQVHVVYDRAVMHFDQLAKAIEICASFQSWSMEHDEAHNKFRTIKQIQTSYHQGSSPMLNLGVLLGLTGRFESKDIRDRIFALLGLCRDSKTLLPLPSYHQNPIHISRDLTRAMIQNQMPLDGIFFGVGCSQHQISTPSWNIDWFAKELPRPLLRFTRVKSRLNDKDSVRQVLSADVNSLKLRGAILGTVVQLSTVLTEKKSIADDSAYEGGFDTKSTVFQYYGRTLHLNMGKCLLQASYWPRPPIKRSHGDYLVWKVSDDAEERILAHCVRGNKRIATMKVKTTSTCNGKDVINSCIDWLNANNRLMEQTRSLGFLRRRAVIGHYVRSLGEIWGLLVLVLIASLIYIAIHFSNNVYPVFSLPFLIVVPGAAVFRGTLASFWWKALDSDIQAALKESRRLFVCDTGVMGVAGSDCRIGDKIAILGGCGNGSVLRPTRPDDSTSFRLVCRSKPCLSRADFAKYLLLSNRLNDSFETKDFKREVDDLSSGDSGRKWWQDINLV